LISIECWFKKILRLFEKRLISVFVRVLWVEGPNKFKKSAGTS